VNKVGENASQTWKYLKGTSVGHSCWHDRGNRKEDKDQDWYVSPCTKRHVIWKNALLYHTVNNKHNTQQMVHRYTPTY
jgi:hypothetical protein